ncbi:hypothetical protein FRB99_000428 [Tulasnella sp. 403]|nr:hypothetical protein FRB99_000428 [Tulasnella sp. 403]
MFADFLVSSAEAVTRLAGRYDLVVVTGGIGPTDNDKTYAAVANAFGLSLQVHQDSLQRMEAYNATRRHLANLSDEKRQQRMKLVTLPSGPGVEVLHVARNIWTPVVRIQQKVALLPGDPAIYQDLVERLKPYLNIPSIQKRRV